MVQKLHFRCGADQGGVKVWVPEEREVAVLVHQGCMKIVSEIEDRALVGHFVGVRHGAFVAGLGHQHAAAIGVQRVAKDVEKKIAFAHITDAERFAILWFGRAAVGTPAFEVDDAVESGGVEGVDVGFHGIC